MIDSSHIQQSGALFYVSSLQRLSFSHRTSEAIRLLRPFLPPLSFHPLSFILPPVCCAFNHINPLAVALLNLLHNTTFTLLLRASPYIYRMGSPYSSGVI